MFSAGGRQFVTMQTCIISRVLVSSTGNLLEAGPLSGMICRKRCKIGVFTKVGPLVQCGEMGAPRGQLHGECVSAQFALRSRFFASLYLGERLW